MSREGTTRCGLVAIVGRPNVGKSTLLNRLLKHKISITSSRPQTTRHTILGIHTVADTQVIYVDTPGLHLHARKAINRYMNRAAAAVLEDVDVVVMVIEGTRWEEEDENVLTRLRTVTAPVFLAINKVDMLRDKARLLPSLEQLAARRDFAAIVPISATTGEQIDVLEAGIVAALPENPFLFPEDQITDRSERFFAAEIIREKLTRSLGKELPYALTVEIEQFEEGADLLRIGAVVWVERKGQKAIVIGKGGEQLKRVGIQARGDMEALLGRKVFLQLWVKVREKWSDDERALRSMGYGEY